MAGMVGNKYQDMAKQIMAEMSSDAAPKAMPVQAKRKMSPEEMKKTPAHEAVKGEDSSVAATVEAEMKAEGVKEGTDQWYSERASRIIEAHDASEFVMYPAEQAFKELGLLLTPEDAQIYDEADPETRFEMLNYLITESADQGSLAEFDDMVQDSKTGTAPTQMQPK